MEMTAGFRNAEYGNQGREFQSITVRIWALQTCLLNEYFFLCTQEMHEDINFLLQ